MENVKHCSDCQGQVPQAAIKCMHCGSDLVKKSRMVTFFLNLLIPGLGYVNQKKVTKGIVVFFSCRISLFYASNSRAVCSWRGFN